MSIIALSGKAGSGKDTVGLIIQYLLANNNLPQSLQFKNLEEVSFETQHSKQYSGFEIKKFADKLKDIVCILLNCTREQLEDREFKEKELGEEWGIPLQEEWKAVIGYEGLYEVSSFGKIKSLNRLDSMSRVVEETIKSQHIGTTGYPAITLNKDGKKKTKVVHQLVAESFLGHIPDNYNGVINHIDNIKTNNRLDNLEVVSSRYNTQYSKSTEGVYERRNKFEVYIRIGGKKTYLGSYTSKEEALKVRNKKLQEIDTFIPLRYVARQWTPRLLLQIMGTQIGRDIIHPNIWCNSLMSEYKIKQTFNTFEGVPILASIKEITPKWIITDMRFPNEMEAIKQKSGITIKVIRDTTCPECGVTGGHKMYVHKDKSLTDLHPSETALDNAKFDYEIINDAEIPELIEKVKQILIKENII